MIEVMLCQTGDLSDLKRQGFVAEPKYDGTRCLVIKEKGEVTLQNRHGIIYTVRLPEIVEAAKAIPGSFILDGEVLYVNPKTGREEFTPCQRRCSTQFPDPLLIRQYPVVFKAFDIIKLGSEYVVDKPYWKRKTLLRCLLRKASNTIQFVPYMRDVEAAWREVVKEQREGLILKDFNSRYALGERSWSWLKVKNWRTEECEVVGYTFSSKGRPFGSLVLAKNGRFKGCVGSGFSDYELMKIGDILRNSPEKPKPFPEVVVGESYRAVNTGLRVLVQYYQTTESGVLRHPVFIKTL